MIAAVYQIYCDKCHHPITGEYFMKNHQILCQGCNAIRLLKRIANLDHMLDLEQYLIFPGVPIP